MAPKGARHQSTKGNQKMPAQKAQTENQETTEKPNFDSTFGEMVVESTEELPTSTRGPRKANHFLEPLRDSLKNGGAKTVKLPENAVNTALSQIRRAAQELNCGTRTVQRANGDGTVNLHFQAKAEKIAGRGRKRKAEG